MIRGTWKIKAQTIIDSKRFERKFNRNVQGMSALVARDMQPVLREEFSAPGPVHYPIAWKITGDAQSLGKRANMPGGMYSLQKAAYFATGGFGKGIPSKRTGASDAAWEFLYVAGDLASGEFRLENKVSYTKFLRGTFRASDKHQQRFHINTGYERAIVIKERVFRRARVILVVRYRETLGSFGSLTT
jgi:hypothetical protein